MSKIDASEALKIYRAFCRQTESVIQYLSIARRLHNALKEYLEDPNFEQNRLEYKNNKAIIEGRPTQPPPKKER